jgi:probable HAF family extracellular repeat protein
MVNYPEQYHAVLWTDAGKILDLGTLKTNSMALGINNFGEIVGGSSVKEGWSGERIGSFWDNNIAWVLFDHSCVAFIWSEKNGMSQLPLLEGGDASSAHAINDIGQVVGWSYTSEGKVHAFVWTSKDGIKDLGTLPDDVESVAYGINNLGQVVGYSMKEDGTRHAVIWTMR